LLDRSENQLLCLPAADGSGIFIWIGFCARRHRGLESFELLLLRWEEISATREDLPACCRPWGGGAREEDEQGRGTKEIHPASWSKVQGVASRAEQRAGRGWGRRRAGEESGDGNRAREEQRPRSGGRRPPSRNWLRGWPCWSRRARSCGTTSPAATPPPAPWVTAQRRRARRARRNGRSRSPGGGG
jgi:hypothetical protein